MELNMHSGKPQPTAANGTCNMYRIRKVGGQVHQVCLSKKLWDSPGGRKDMEM